MHLRNCRHTYDKKTAFNMIDTYIKKKRPLTCPVVGCSNKTPIVKVDFQKSHLYSKGMSGMNYLKIQAHLHTDPEVQKKVAKQKKR